MLQWAKRDEGFIVLKTCLNHSHLKAKCQRVKRSIARRISSRIYLDMVAFISILIAAASMISSFLGSKKEDWK